MKICTYIKITDVIVGEHENFKLTMTYLDGTLLVYY